MTTMREMLDVIAAELTPEENALVEAWVQQLAPFWNAPMSPSAQKGFALVVAEVYADLIAEREGRE